MKIVYNVVGWSNLIHFISLWTIYVYNGIKYGFGRTTLKLTRLKLAIGRIYLLSAVLVTGLGIGIQDGVSVIRRLGSCLLLLAYVKYQKYNYNYMKYYVRTLT